VTGPAAAQARRGVIMRGDPEAAAHAMQQYRSIG